ncbi:MAG: hypothetical protein ACRC1J_04925 [Sandaracinobacteroides sp.]
MTILMIRRRKAGLRTQGISPVRAHPGILSGAELRRIVAEMVD